MEFFLVLQYDGLWGVGHSLIFLLGGSSRIPLVGMVLLCLLGGFRNVYTHLVARSNSKVDVLKYSLSGKLLNNILPLVVSIGSLSLIKSPT